MAKNETKLKGDEKFKKHNQNKMKNREFGPKKNAQKSSKMNFKNNKNDSSKKEDNKKINYVLHPRLLTKKLKDVKENAHREKEKAFQVKSNNFPLFSSFTLQNVKEMRFL
ncbi:hypothetical protein ACKWTF_002161 [Chironomus riparius]